jgi:release factor glutamine methyltransferase
MGSAATGGTVASILGEAEALLTRAPGIASPALEARELLAALLEVPRSWPGLNGGEATDELSRAALLTAAARRVAGAPMAYAVGCAAFRHLTLDVDERVLIPRPETEVLVDLVLARSGEGGTVVDVGTGSGCIALALASEGKFSRVIGTDVSLDALALAGRNVVRCAASLHVPVELLHGSVLEPVRGERLRAVVSNPPYVAGDEAASLPPEVRDWEPPIALYSPGRGMGITSSLVHQASDVLEDDGLFALEVDCRRASLVAELVAAHGDYEDVSVMLDLVGRERFVLARRRRRARNT